MIDSITQAEFFNILDVYQNGRLSAEFILAEYSAEYLLNSMVNLQQSNLAKLKQISNLRWHIYYSGKANASKRRQLKRLRQRFEEVQYNYCINIETPFDWRKDVKQK